MDLNKAEFLSALIFKDIDGTFVQLEDTFGFYSAILKQCIWAPRGFISDQESVPVFRSKSKRAGVIHDYLSRIDAVPSVSKILAARIYLEAMTTRDRLYYSQEAWYKRFWLWIYRHVKSLVVRYAWGYWKKHKVMASYEELRS